MNTNHQSNNVSPQRAEALAKVYILVIVAISLAMGLWV